MLLYDIYYHGAGIDPSRRLPKAPSKGMRIAKNTNGDGHWLANRGGKWEPITSDDAGRIMAAVRAGK